MTHYYTDQCVRDDDDAVDADDDDDDDYKDNHHYHRHCRITIDPSSQA